MTRACLHNPGATRRRRGLTLVELLLAFSITAIIGLAMATVMTTAARGLSSSKEARSGLQRAHAAYIRTRAYTDSGLCLLSVAPKKGFAFWLHDETPGGRINLYELRVFWWNNDDGTLTVERVVPPDAWAQELVDSYNIPVSAATDFFHLMDEQRVLGYTKIETIADGIISSEVAFATDDPQDAPRFRLTLVVSTGGGDQEPILMTFGLTNHLKPL